MGTLRGTGGDQRVLKHALEQIIACFSPVEGLFDYWLYSVFHTREMQGGVGAAPQPGVEPLHPVPYTLLA